MLTHCVVVEPVPRDRGIPPVVDYILDNLVNEACVKQGMHYLAQITKEENSSIDKSGKRVIAKAMKDYIQEAEVQISGCNVLNNVVPTGEERKFPFTCSGIFLF